MNEKKLIILLSLILLICGIAMIYLMTNNPAQDGQNSTIRENSTTLAVSSVGGPFTMVNHMGEAVTEKDYEGKYKLMFFGFTHCPGICPGELTKMSDVLDILEEENQAENIVPIFITIDPARDDVAAMQEYVEVYDSRLIGLTGTQEQVDAMKDAYKVHASKIEMEMMDPGQYMMDHSTFTYLMSPQNQLLLVFDMQEKPQEIAAEIKGIL